MKTKSSRWLAVFLAVTTAPTALLAANSSLIKTPLNHTGLDADASGRVVMTLKAKSSEMVVQVENLEPRTVYQIEVDGIVQTEFSTDEKGKAKVKFKGPKSGKKEPFDFDPRGKLIRVLADTQSLLEATISAVGEPLGAQVSERANLEPVDPASRAKGRAEYQLKKDNRRSFRLDLSNASGGPFGVFVDGIKRGDLVLKGKSGRLVFAFGVGTGGGDTLPLDFDPRGAVIDLVSDGEVRFTGEMEAKARGINEASPKVGRVGIAPVGGTTGQAEARLRIDDRARRQLSVGLEGAAVGDYDLFVGGVNRGGISVGSTPVGTRGEIEFTPSADDPDELPLDFDPVGETISIRQGATTLFESVFEPDLDDGMGRPGAEPPSELEELMASTGLDPDAKARARYRIDDKNRHTFHVEIEDAPAGDYDLIVAGTKRGKIRAVSTATGVEGEIEFSNKPAPGDKPLNFDPRGQMIEIVGSEGVFFSHLFGDGSLTGAGGVVPFEIDRPLLSSGEDEDGSARGKLKRKPDGELSFAVEVEDVEAGDYELLVSGTVRGAITVAAVIGGTSGQIAFETAPESGEALLDFPVFGQEVILRKGTTVFFSRILPTP